MAIVITATIIVLMFGVFAYIGYLEVTWARRRARQLALVAQELAFDFAPEGDPALSTRLDSFRLGGGHRICRMRNLLRGDANGLSVAIFDFDYTIDSDIGARQTVIAFQSPDLRLPSFVLTPRNFLHAIGRLFGVTEVVFSDRPEFSRRCLLRATDEAAVRALFTDIALDHFQTTQNLFVEGVDDLILIYREGRTVPPQKIRNWMEDGFKTLSVLRGRS